MDRTKAENPGHSTGIPETVNSLKEPGWHEPLPLKLPAPTPWPAILAFGATLLVFGIVTSLVFSAVGFLFFAAGIAGWVERMRHESEE